MGRRQIDYIQFIWDRKVRIIYVVNPWRLLNKT